jgi:hypothetical protein
MSIPYCCLNSKHKELRLLKLLPAPHKDSPLQSCITHARLGIARYKALSYVWGDSAHKRSLEVIYEGPSSARQELGSITKTTIGANLDAALRHIRKQETEVVLWVDAICINQNDNAEKSSQVRLMALIYKEATEVLVWLGLATESTNAAMDAFNDIGTEAGRFVFVDTALRLFGKLISPRTWEEKDPVDEQGQSLKSFLNKISGKGSSTGVGIFQPSGVADLLTRTWWSRVWVLQEFLMAKTATFICGHKRVHEANLVLAVDAFFGYSIYLSGRDPTRDPHATIYEKTFLEPRPGKRAGYLLNIRRAFRNEGTPLMDLMGSLYANKKDPVDATDPRDRVFALLGIAEDDMGLQPNYDLTCAEVYIEVTSAMLQSGDIELLSYCRPHLNNLRVPSWVVDWTSEIGHYLNPSERRSSGLRPNPYYETEEFGDVQVSIQTESEPVLSLRGTLVDRIQLTTQGWQENRTFCYQDLNSLAASLESWAPAGPSLSRDVAEIILRHVVCRRWLLMLQALMSSSKIEGSINMDDLTWEILSCGDKHDDGIKNGNRPENFVEAMKLLAASEDSMNYLHDMQNRGHFFYIAGIIESKAQNCRACYSENGYFGYVPEPAQTADFIVVFVGATVPFVVRPTEHVRYKLLGPACIQGVMESDYTKDVNVQTTFDLV